MTARISTFTPGISFACEIRAVEGNTLKIESSSPFDLRTPVKVENARSLWMGEVWACDPEGLGFHIEVEVSQVLRDLRGVERMAARFRQTPKPEFQPVEEAERTPQKRA